MKPTETSIKTKHWTSVRDAEIPVVALLLATAPRDVAGPAREEIAREAPSLIRCPECGSLAFKHAERCETSDRWLDECYLREIS